MPAFAEPIDLDDGPRARKRETTRTCALTRRARPTDELIRFVLSPDGEVVPDLRRRLPGRGLWLTASRDTVAQAMRRHHFERGFKRQVRVSPDLPGDIDRLMLRGVADALAIAAKAGEVVSGFAKVEAVLTARQAILLLHAADGAADGIRKLDALADALARADRTRPVPVITVLASADLDLALGRSNVIHAAVLAGPASGTLRSRCQMLVRYRRADDGHDDDFGLRVPEQQALAQTDDRTGTNAGRA